MQCDNTNGDFVGAVAYVSVWWQNIELKQPIPVRIRVHCYNKITLKHIGHYKDTYPSDCIPQQIDGRLWQYDNTVGHSCNKNRVLG